MTGTELRTAFINMLPVKKAYSGQPSQEYKFISRILYRHQLGTSKPAVDVELVSDDGTKHVENVEFVYISEGVINNEIRSGMTFQIPPKIKSLCIKRSSVMVNEYPERRYDEIHELEFTRFSDGIELRCLFYNRQYVARKVDKPRRVHPDSIVENFSSHPEYYYDMLDRLEYEREHDNEHPAYKALKSEGLSEAKEKFHNFTEELRRQVELSNLELVK